MTDTAILWRRLDQPGHEWARLTPARRHLTGTAIFAHDGQPCRLDYAIVCDADWQTLSGEVTGWVGNEAVEIAITIDDARRWQLNGTECGAVEGCLDLDLGFSPSTNLLPIRRLNLTVGQEAEARAAWLSFPGFKLEPLEQRYRRLADKLYRYESAGGSFVTELRVDAAGFVSHYPDFWTSEQLA